MSTITPEQRDLFTAFEMVMDITCNCSLQLEELNGKAYLVWEDDDTLDKMVIDIAASEQLDEDSKEYKYLIYEEEMDEEDEDA